jgi:AcrR family transcriptional regulator
MQNPQQIKKLDQDGRRLRSLASQNIIVDAMMNLIQSGILEPTAQQVADEASLGIRTVFRQAQDKETLFSKMDEKVRATYEKKIKNTKPTGNIAKRIKDLIELEADIFDANLQFYRATVANKWKYRLLQKNYERNQHHMKRLLYKWLPEINDLKENVQILLTSMNSAGYWVELRENRMLSSREAIELKISIFEEILLEKKFN